MSAMIGSIEGYREREDRLDNAEITCSTHNQLEHFRRLKSQISLASLAVS